MTPQSLLANGGCLVSFDRHTRNVIGAVRFADWLEVCVAGVDVSPNAVIARSGCVHCLTERDLVAIKLQVLLDIAAFQDSEADLSISALESRYACWACLDDGLLHAAEVLAVPNATGETVQETIARGGCLHGTHPFSVLVYEVQLLIEIAQAYFPTDDYSVQAILSRVGCLICQPSILWIRAVSGNVSSEITPTPPVQVVSVTVTPDPFTVDTDNLGQFTAVVEGELNGQPAPVSQAVTWYVNGILGGNATIGTITVAGLYTAPDDADRAASVTIRARSVVDPSFFDDATCNLPPFQDFRVFDYLNTSTKVLIGYDANGGNQADSTFNVPKDEGLLGDFQRIKRYSWTGGAGGVWINAIVARISDGFPGNSASVSNPGPGKFLVRAIDQYGAATGEAQIKMEHVADFPSFDCPSFTNPNGFSLTNPAFWIDFEMAIAENQNTFVSDNSGSYTMNEGGFYCEEWTDHAQVSEPLPDGGIDNSQCITTGTSSKYAGTANRSNRTRLWFRNYRSADHFTHIRASWKLITPSACGLSYHTIDGTSATYRLIFSWNNVAIYATANGFEVFVSGTKVDEYNDGWPFSAGETYQFDVEVKHNREVGRVLFSVRNIDGTGNHVSLDYTGDLGQIGDVNLFSEAPYELSLATLPADTSEATDHDYFSKMDDLVFFEGPKLILVDVTPKTITVDETTTRQFAVTVDGATVNQAVTWEVIGGASNGTINGSGLYTAPASVPDPSDIVVRATSSVDGTSYGESVVTVAPHTPALSDWSGLVAWYEADRLSGLVDDDDITTWGDASDTGHDMSQGTEARRPIFKSNVKNGLPVVRFTAANQHFMGCSDTGMPTGDTTFVGVFKSSGTLANGTLGVLLTWGIENFSRMACFCAYRNDAFASGQNRIMFTDYGEVAPVGSTPNITDTWVVAVITKVGTTIKCKVNSTTGSTDVFVDINTGLIGAFNMGRLNSNTSFFNGDVAALAVYNRELDSTEIGNVMDLLGSKYGITIS